MNAIHIPPLSDASPLDQSFGQSLGQSFNPGLSQGATRALSPEQRAALAAIDAIPGLTAHVTIEGPVDPVRLRGAVERAIDAHEVLRTAFGPVDGYRGWRQWTLSERPALDWSETTLASDDPSTVDAWLDEMARPLDLAQGRSVRAGLARLSESRHVLALRVSTLVADEGSARGLLTQMAANEAPEDGQAAGELRKQNGEEGAPPLQYSQYVEWRGELALGEEAAAGAAYWEAHLSAHGAPPSSWRGPQLPAPLRPAAGRVEARRVVDAALAGQIGRSALGAERLLHAVWLMLLARLNGHEPFLSGWRHDCRDDYPVMQGAVGPYDKLLPVAVTVTDDTRVGDWLDHCAGVAAAHVQSQEYWAVDAPPVPVPLEAIFHWRRQGAWPVRASVPVVIRPPGPLTLEVQGEGGIELVIHADGRRHSQQAVERLLGQVITLLHQVLERPDAPLRALDPVGAAERAALLRWAHGDHGDVGGLTVSQQIAAWAVRSPQAPALVADGMLLDYRTLNERANRLARAMGRLGLRPGGLVALNLPRGGDLIVAMLATWRAGAAYLPLEPAWPEARRQALLAEARPALTIDATMLAGDLLTPHGQPPIQLTQLDSGMPERVPLLTDLAYVLYTSGSTGQPKGVAIEQGQLLHYVAGSTAAMDLANSRRWALTSSVVADLGNTALFGALINGACLVVASEDDTRHPAAFARFLKAHRIDALKMVPSHLEALLAEAETDAPVPATVILGGEAAPRGLLQRIRQLSPGAVLHNHYGPTECSVGVLVHRVQDSDLAADADGALPLTRVLPNNRALVLDEAMRLVPAGGVGEVYLGGPQLCRGYLRASADPLAPASASEPATRLTDAFVDDPFHPGERLYRTGDLARVLPEGGVRLTGRADHQVKLRGFRVDPAEVEVALLGLHGVRQAAVQALPGPAGELQLWAWVVAAEGVPLEEIALRQALTSILPEPMVPSCIHCIRELPRLPNGKLDRAAIRAMAASAGAERAQGRVVSRPPRDALEAVLSQGMGLLLGRESIGMDEDFFELGGHSLLVIRLVARLRKRLGIEIEPGLVFDHPTVAELAAALRAGPWDLSGFDRLAATDWQPTETSTAAHP
ncbi:non-ribosomal peptide synthetase [Roseateles amylovorans]|uniref:Amino acid adenylation domain-containing protein n=1 Tax=Roseateles amylovorans TaxID=2978473 RepID=A0ABY6ATR0_9BURK|nr:non-ribosomal peptide synthetase [Roseateles amylovorans]UXH76222.1 amino acid adenylation domain-containing protein [Roseateles amylovorans]